MTRFISTSTADEAILHDDCYLPHFRQCLEQGGAESLMSAYNKVNGEHCGENKYLLDTVVRSIWGMEDIVITSDWMFGFRDVPRSIKAGLDVEMPYRGMRAKHLAAAVAADKPVGTVAVAVADIDRIAKRIIRMVLNYHARIALTDKPPPPPTESIIHAPAHRQLAKQAAIEGTVVLSNDAGLLPLRNVKRLLVVWTSSDIDSNRGQRNQESSPRFSTEPMILPLSRRACEEADAVFVLAGYTGEDEGEGGIDKDGLKPEMIATVLPQWFPFTVMARLALWTLFKMISLMFLFKGKRSTPRLGGDRSTLRLTEADEKIVMTVSQVAGEKLVLGLEVSGPVILLAQVRADTAAIIITGYGGCEFGNTLREVLPIRSSTVVSGDTGYCSRKKRQAAYPFGYGRGYGIVDFVPGSFVVPPKLDGRFFDVTVSVRNVGDHETTHVIQIYAGATKRDNAVDYERALVGFARIKLQVGEKGSCTVQCRMDPVSHYNTKTREFDVAQGDYHLIASSYEGDEEGLVTVVEAPWFSWSAQVQKKQQE
ncbi:hypothetical protein QFC24_006736 [Naganishia onofrii]|uniref:Uncharacterized protein n=1 Tax=Naganishia onofrii TaxID=1851511 RepID=A0ACC2WYA9_9TREE|nr:hypothetical protein QFC24_006736 [Naganishia onofrii]